VNIDQLLGNDSEINNETTAVVWQQLCKYGTLLEPLVGSSQRATMEVLLEAIFSMGPLRAYTIRLDFESLSVVQCSGAERVGW
jgi:hypothetical protein